MEVVQKMSSFSLELQSSHVIEEHYNVYNLKDTPICIYPTAYMGMSCGKGYVFEVLFVSILIL